MKRISQKIIAAIIVCVIISISVVGLITTRIAENKITQEAENGLQYMTEAYAAEMNSEMTSYEGIVKGLAVYLQSVYDTAQISNKAYNDAVIADMCRQALTVYGTDDRILSMYAYINPDYQQAVSGYFIQDGEDAGVAETDYAEYLTGTSSGFEFLYQAMETTEPFWMDPYYDQDLQDTSTSFCVPVYKNSLFVGAVGLDISFSDFNEMVTSAKVYENGSASLLNAEHHYIVDAEYGQEDTPGSAGMDLLMAAMENDLTGVVEQTVSGHAHFCAFSTLDNGYIFMATVEKDEVLAAVKEMRKLAVAAGVLMAIIACIISLILGMTISNPIKAIAKDLSVVEQGDFTGNLHRRYLKKWDETGLLARSMNAMQETMGRMVGVVNRESNVMNHAISETDTAVNELMDRVAAISAVSEELAANMEETAATAVQLSDSASNLKNVADEMASQNREGQKSVEEIAGRAVTLKRESEAAASAAEALMKENEAKLRDALEQAKAIEEINELTGAIMKIASQTNLLALNASIESVKAGEAGKSFAVVADEIRHLAENSQETAQSIRSITDKVVSNVEKLRETSGEMLEFMDEHVRGSYGKLIHTSEQYNDDAGIMKGILDSFSGMAYQISEETELLNSASQNLKAATVEGAKGTNDLALDAESVMHNTTHVRAQAENLTQTSGSLSSTIARFQVVQEADDSVVEE
ncbi:MAG: methyl-accepting chemotaxis protein [Anaerovoracaceae bacterium]